MGEVGEGFEPGLAVVDAGGGLAKGLNVRAS